MSLIGFIRRCRRYALRVRQWRAALELAGKEARLWPMLRAMLSGRVSRQEYHRRIRHGCNKCLIYDPKRKLCRLLVPGFVNPDKKDKIVGCQCYVPFLAKTRAPYKKVELPTGRRFETLPSGLRRALPFDPGIVREGCWGYIHIGEHLGWGATRAARPHELPN